MLNKGLNYISFLFNQEFRHADRIAVFKKLILLFIILNSLIVLIFSAEILGPNAYFQPAPVNMNGSSPLFSFWNFPSLIPYNWVFLVMLIVFSALAYLEKQERIMTILVFIFWMNFMARTTVINTGGEVLVGLFLFYLMFMGKLKTKDENLKMIQNALNNTFFFAILFQFLSVYIISVWWKLIDEGWMNGLAFMHATNIKAYSFFGLGSFMYDHVWLSKLLTYGTIFYQVTFPIAIWSKRLKPYWLFIGVAFHIGIAVFMGIFSFGLIMILSFSLFLSQKQLEGIGKRLPFLR